MVIVTLALKLRYLVVIACIALASWWFYYAANHMEVILFPSSVADEFHLMFECPMVHHLKPPPKSSKSSKRLSRRYPTTSVPTSSHAPDVGRRLRDGRRAIWDRSDYSNPYSQRSRTADQIIADLRPLTNKIEGVTRVAYHVKTGGPPVGPPVKLSVVASDDEARVKLTNDIVFFMRTLPGATDVSHDMEPGKKQVQIRLNYDRLAELGLTVADIAQNVRIAYDGQNVTNIRYRDEDVAFKVILDGSAVET